MDKYQEYSDENLITMYREGDAEIMDYIMEKYKPLVRKHANTLFLIGGEPDDLIQEGMIGLFKAIRDYKDDRDAGFFHFAEICIKRQLATALEASNRKKQQPLNNYVSFSNDEAGEGVNLEEIVSGRAENPEQLILEQEKVSEFVERIKEKLSSMERSVLNLYLEGYNYNQIAIIMDKPAKSIDNALQRIRQKVRTIS